MIQNKPSPFPILEEEEKEEEKEEEGKEGRGRRRRGGGGGGGGGGRRGGGRGKKVANKCGEALPSENTHCSGVHTRGKAVRLCYGATTFLWKPSLVR